MTSTRIEFAVQMTCEACVKSITNCLATTQGIESYDVNLKIGSVTVQTTLPAQEILQLFESTGRKAVVRGLGGTLAAVVILDTGVDTIKGVVRFVQENKDLCIVDGTVDGLQSGQYRISIHECGDMSQSCESVGEFFQPLDFHSTTGSRIYGDLGIVDVDHSGRAAFRLDDNVLQLSDIIGRALVVSEATSGRRLSCGIVARSAGLFQNPKTICACDGLTIWNEKVEQVTTQNDQQTGVHGKHANL